jgi:signal transduction histidine kinase
MLMPALQRFLLHESSSHLWNILWYSLGSLNFHAIYFVFFIICIVYLTRKNAVRAKVIPALPVLFFWGVCFTCVGVYYLLNQFLHLPVPAIINLMGLLEPFEELICLGWLVVFLSWNLFQRYQQLQKEIAYQALAKEKERHELIAQQKVELENQVTDRTAELKQSLENLRSTQAQLVQAEKMASLGELTAGIAHEIQNPLNFVNNFSEVNAELMEEMEQEFKSGNATDAFAIAETIKQNIGKVRSHGKRADAIVKSMLQHSRISSGQKELVNINIMAEEYLRLSYQGIKAKDSLFDATITADLDASIGKINIIPQDISRVLVNLYNNAFYAVREKAQQSPKGYEPTVSVMTKKHNGMVEITVKDNGNGIPENIRQKIFQPFFTTKPTGQGTGLGLSLSYDIVKAHGGEIKVSSEDGNGSQFIICLPITS